eukprot:Nk52_evm47s96 gene=Nk52_evmTU47s96
MSSTSVTTTAASTAPVQVQQLAVPTGETKQKVIREQTPFKKAGITGFAVIAEMVTGGLFMENVKMEKQRTSLPYPVLMKRILGQGFRGFEAGLWPWGVVLGLTKGTVLGGSKVEIYHRCQQFGLSKKNSQYVSGFGAGAVQGAFMSPILLARTRVNQSLTERAAAGKVDTSVFAEMKLSQQVISNAIRKEGFMVITQGMGVCVAKRALDWGSRFVFLQLIHDQMLRSKGEVGNPKALNDAERLGASFFAGALSVVVTVPIDRFMPLLQASDRKESVMREFARKVHTEGYSTVFRGWFMRTVHTGYHTMFAIFIADKIYAYLS